MQRLEEFFLFEWDALLVGRFCFIHFNIVNSIGEFFPCHSYSFDIWTAVTFLSQVDFLLQQCHQLLDDVRFWTELLTDIFCDFLRFPNLVPRPHRLGLHFLDKDLADSSHTELHLAHDFAKRGLSARLYG